jgi:diguanylate cyclase (GGDEF)-like protein
VVVSRDWLLAVDLGSFAMAGMGLLFVVVWAVDRSRTCALFFAGAIACYIAGTVALSVPTTAALASSIHGVLFPAAMALLADGLLRRVLDRLPRGLLVGYFVGMTALVWYFANLSPLLVGRVITQNLGTALLFLVVGYRLGARTSKSKQDWAALIAVISLVIFLGIGVLVAPFSAVPREIVTPADLDSYMRSNLELCLIISSTIVLPACMVTLLAVTVIDMAQELQVQRDCDELTGLFNRRGFNRRVEAGLRSGRRCVMIVADLDFFKAVNDTLGHSGGDQVLVAFARMLSECPVEGRIVGRIGGEEFAIFLPDCDVGPAVRWAESVRGRMAAQVGDRGGGIAAVTASFGITVGQAHSQLRLLFDAADKALYQAKLGGRNQIVVDA